MRTAALVVLVITLQTIGLFPEEFSYYEGFFLYFGGFLCIIQDVFDIERGSRKS